jgi:hypothetical protein
MPAFPSSMFNFFPRHGGSLIPASALTSGSVTLTGATTVAFVQTNKVVLNGDFSSAASIPTASTPPQNSQGAQVLSLVHTPLKAGNLLRVRVQLDTKIGGGNQYGAALFVDSEVYARAHYFTYMVGGADTAFPLILEYDMVVTNTTPTTLAVRIGNNGGTNTVTVWGGGTIYGGIQQSFLCVDEYEIFPSARQ